AGPQVGRMDGEFFLVVLDRSSKFTTILECHAKIIGSHLDTDAGSKPHKHSPTQYEEPEAVHHWSLSYRPTRPRSCKVRVVGPEVLRASDSFWPRLPHKSTDGFVRTCCAVAFRSAAVSRRCSTVI